MDDNKELCDYIIQKTCYQMPVNMQTNLDLNLNK